MKEQTTKSLSEILLDENNNDPISLQTEEGKNIKFQQIAIIPHEIDDERKICCALRPIEGAEGLDENAILFFSLEFTEEGEEYISLVDDEDLIEELHAALVEMLPIEEE